MTMILIAFVSVFQVFTTSQGFSPDCKPSAQVLFGDEAIEVLDSLETAGSTDYFTQAILAHNIAFRTKDATMTQVARQFLDSARVLPADSVSYLMYQASLDLIAIRDQAGGMKAARTFLGFLPLGIRSPKEQAREKFKEMSKLIEQAPYHVNNLLIRATASVEIAEHLPELLSSTQEDLQTLETIRCASTESPYRWFSPSTFDVSRGTERTTSPRWLTALRPYTFNRAEDFYLLLTEAKYYYKRAILAIDRGKKGRNDTLDYLLAMENILAQCRTLACRGYMRSDLFLWEERFTIAFRRLDDLD